MVAPAGMALSLSSSCARWALRLAAIPSCTAVTSRRIDDLLQRHLFRPSVRYGSVATVTYGLQ